MIRTSYIIILCYASDVHPPPVSAASPHRSTTNAKKKKRAAPSDLEPDQSAAKIAAVEESVPGAAAVKESTSVDIDAEMMLDL